MQHDAVKRLTAMKPPEDFARFPEFWQRYQAQLSLALGFDYVSASGVMTVPDATDLESRPSEPLNTMLQYIGSSGTATNTKLLPVSKTANLGCVISPLPLSASDAGSDATVTISAFTAYFDFGNLSVSGASITGLSYSTFYYIYLTNFSYTNGSYSAALATTAGTTLVGSNTNFYVGSITTPAAAAPATSGSGGGGAVVPGGDIEP